MNLRTAITGFCSLPRRSGRLRCRTPWLGLLTFAVSASLRVTNSSVQDAGEGMGGDVV